MLSFALIFVASLFFTGIVVRVKSLASGRKGPGVFQPIRDIWRLLRKGAVYSRTSSLVFQLAPSVYFASILAAIAVVPLGSYGGIISFSCDFVFFAYVLALGKFFCIIAALDTGSSFEGMGASREALFSMLAEPAFFILMGTLGLLTGHTSFLQIFSGLHIDSNLSYILVTIACFLLIMICMILFYATSFDSIAYTAACYSYKKLGEDEKPHTLITLLWCVLLIVLPIALVFSESSMNNIQSVSIISAFPIGIIMIVIIWSLIKDAKKYMNENK